MNHDIRLNVGLFANPKAIDLELELGEAGLLALIRLWTQTAAFRPDGDLGRVSPSQVERLAGWHGQAGALYDALVRFGWLDEEEAQGIRDGELFAVPRVRVHDWTEHQPYASKAQVRREKAQKAARARWEKDDLGRKAEEKASDARGNATSKAPRSARRSAPPPPPLGGGETPPPPSTGRGGGSPADRCCELCYEATPPTRSPAVRTPDDERPHAPPRPLCGDHYDSWYARDQHDLVEKERTA